jgi:hypothetical protein
VMGEYLVLAFIVGAPAACGAALIVWMLRW